jgi:hypothetical protein
MLFPVSAVESEKFDKWRDVHPQLSRYFSGDAVDVRLWNVLSGSRVFTCFRANDCR